jgi:Domain of unknown function (DUF4158)
MAVRFLTAAQRDRYGRYPDVVTPDDLARCFHLSDDDRAQILICRGEHNRLGFALQLTTVRYLGTFLNDPVGVPSPVLLSLSRQLAIPIDGLQRYRKGEQREVHVTTICNRYGYGEITGPRVGLRLTRWLYGVCWTGTERLGALFDRAISWLLTHKILLPGCTTLERFVVRVRARVEARLWRLLTRGITAQQKDQLQRLLLVPEGDRVSSLDQLRSGPTRISGPAIRAAIDRLNAVRVLGITVPMKARIPSSRIASLARFANRAKAQAISRMPTARRIATLVAFVHVSKPPHRTRCWKCWRCCCTICLATRSRLIRRHGCGHSRIWTNRLLLWRRPAFWYWIPMCRMKICARKYSRKFHEQHCKTLLNESLP